MGVLEVVVPMAEPVRETYLEVHEVETGILVTLIEILSPANKFAGLGRRKYERKRNRVLETLTNLVEIDLLRAGEPMPWEGERVRSDYRILVCRGDQRPTGQLHYFGMRQPIPVLPLPLLPGDAEPPMDLGTILHALYDRARFDLRLDYAKSPVPALDESGAAWARAIIATG